MIVHIVTPQLVVLEMETYDITDDNEVQNAVRAALEERGLENWSSIEIEEFTYHDHQIAFITPIKIFIPNFLARLLN